MPDQASKYENQLPKRSSASWASIFSYAAGGASILGFLSSNFLFPQSSISVAHTIFLLVLVFSILLHTYFRDRRKLHRYAQAIYYVHYINHIIRNSIAHAKEGNFKLSKEIPQQSVDAISNCFSVLTGKQCRCSIKELKNDFTINTVVRDSISKKRIHEHHDSKTTHHLEENTDFKNLWYSIYGCSRYFLSNDLIKFWKIHKYENSSFKIVTNPKRSTFCGFTWVTNWKLPYRCTLVLPIRFFSVFDPPPQPGHSAKNSHTKTEYDNWNFWGFLCVDCNSRNVFDAEFAPELGAAFADILYIFHEQTKLILDNKDKIVFKK